MLAGGGWPFQYRNDHYPDLDDTAAIAWAMQILDPVGYAEPVRRAADWIAGMQSRDGGFAAFDADNTCTYLNEIPFADHGALLDPPSADVTARCITLFNLLDRPQYADTVRRAEAWLLRHQEADGSWFGRWGTNYVYGTWSALVALAGSPRLAGSDAIERAANWLEACQRPDGGWGESNDSYEPGGQPGHGPRSTACQTAWALLGLIAAGRAHRRSVREGVNWLVAQQRDGRWSDQEFNAPGFPRVFYLKYHGYSQYFPLWALAAWRQALARSV